MGQGNIKCNSNCGILDNTPNINKYNRFVNAMSTAITKNNIKNTMEELDKTEDEEQEMQLVSSFTFDIENKDIGTRLTV